jgi:High potential iron-sulfur protein
MQISRRSFIIQAAGVASLALAGQRAYAAVQLQESDPAAQALGYRADASHVDRTRYPRFQPNQRCGTCQFYQGKPADASAQCSLFGAKQVSETGWCNAYQARA